MSRSDKRNGKRIQCRQIFNFLVFSFLMFEIQKIPRTFSDCLIIKKWSGSKVWNKNWVTTLYYPKSVSPVMFSDFTGAHWRAEDDEIHCIKVIEE